MTAPYSMAAYSDAVLTALTGLPFPVGDGEAPLNQAPPYAVLYGLGAIPFGGSLADEQEDQSVGFQITAVGSTRAQAETVADLARAELLAATLTVAGRSIMKVRMDPAGSRPTARDEEAGPTLWYAIDGYELLTTI